MRAYVSMEQNKGVTPVPAAAAATSGKRKSANEEASLPGDKRVKKDSTTNFPVLCDVIFRLCIITYLKSLKCYIYVYIYIFLSVTLQILLISLHVFRLTRKSNCTAGMPTSSEHSRTIVLLIGLCAGCF